MSDFKMCLEKLKSCGYKITPQRQELIKALSDSKMQTAEELHKQVIINYPNISLDTIYRNLNLLHSMSVISEINYGDGKGRFKICGQSHHHHLICIKCGSSVELDFCPMELIKERISKHNFKVTNHNFEIFGYCSQCL